MNTTIANLNDDTKERVVAFSMIAVGDRFLTDRWFWEKTSQKHATAVDGPKENNSSMIGTQHRFDPWLKVNQIIS